MKRSPVILIPQYLNKTAMARARSPNFQYLIYRLRIFLDLALAIDAASVDLRPTDNK
jgi:hypothetical protein